MTSSELEKTLLQEFYDKKKDNSEKKRKIGAIVQPTTCDRYTKERFTLQANGTPTRELGLSYSTVLQTCQHEFKFTCRVDPGGDEIAFSDTIINFLINK